MAKELRDALADTAIAINKGQDKIVSKLDEIQTKKEENAESYREDKKTSHKAILSQIKGVETAIKEQKEVESISINNPEAITGDLKAGLQGIIQTLKNELKNFDKNITVKNDFSNFASLFKSSQDKTSVINALKAIENKLDKPEKEEKENVDYTLILSDIATALEVKNNDDVVKVLKDVLAKEYNVQFPGIMDVNLDPELIENKRVRMVLPDDQVAKMSAVGTSNSRPIIENANSGDAKIQIVGSDGKGADVIEANGQDGLVTVSPGHISADNSSNTPLTANSVFTGLLEDITNFGVIVITVKSDVASAINGLSIQQSTDGVNWDCTDVFTIAADTSKVFSFQTCARYMRVVYTNGATDQTYFRLQTIIKPYYVKPSSHRISDNISCEDDAELTKSVLTGLNAGCDEFVNIEATYANGLKTSIYDGETGRRAEVESLGALKVETPIRLIGTTFSNGTKDTNFWTETVTGSGAVTQSGEIILSTGTTANSTAKYETVRKARKITGTTNQFRAVARNVEAPADDCIRRIGPYDDDNGFFTQFDGTTFGLASRKNGVDTVVENGSFNGNVGTTIDFGGGTDFTRVVIEYTALSAKFFLDGTLIHTIVPTTESLTNTLNLPVSMELINEGGNTTDNSYEILFATILRLGELETEAEYKYISANTTTVCKYNAGRLKRILNVDNSGNITIYDNTTATGTVIASIDTVKALGTLDFDVPFSTGLTVVTTLGAKVVVVYE